MMELNVFELLQIKSSAKTVNDVISYARECQNSENLNQLILQFFVNALKRTKEVTADGLEEIESAEDLQDYLLEIYESPENNEDTEVAESVRNFLHLFFEEAFGHNLLDHVLISNWINFLKLVVTHPEIPDNETFKQEALHLLSLLLIPFARLYEVVPADNSSNDLRTSILTSLWTIVDLIPAGFKYKLHSVDITKEVINVIESHFEVFKNESENFLHLYKNMMLVESHALHVMALRSLAKLCGIEGLHETLRMFFQERRPKEGDDSDEDHDPDFLDILLEFMCRKNLKVEVMLLLMSMKNLVDGSEFITEEMRVELYMSIFSGSKKLVAETVKLMLAFGDEVWMQIVNLLNYHAIDTIDFPKLIENLSSVEGFSCDAKDLLRIMVKSLDSPVIAQRAVKIATEILKHDKNQQKEVLQVIDKLLTEALKDERVFMLLVECTNEVAIETLSKFLKENPIHLVSITNCLLKAFVQFNTPVSLYNIVAVLKKFTKIAPDFLLDEVQRVFKQLYLVLIQVDNQHSANPKTSKLSSYETPIIKISTLLENRAWNLMNGPSMKIIFELCKKLFGAADLNNDGRIFSLSIRLLTNFFKHIWTRVQLGRPIPFTTDEIVSTLESFYSSFEEYMNSEEMKIEEGHLILTSFMDLSVMFQPAMKDRSTHEMFHISCFILNKKSVNGIASLVEKLVFPETTDEKTFDDATIFQCELILESWIAFCKNYEALPSLTASEKIVRHYSIKQTFKGHIETLMDHLLLLTKKSIFEQTVAFVTFNLANQDDFASFRQFHHGLEIFLNHRFEDINSKLIILCSICMYVLAKLDNHTNSVQLERDQDRLMVLDYVALFTKNMSPSMKKALVTYIPLDPEKDNLSEPEKEHLVSFKASLVE